LVFPDPRYIDFLQDKTTTQPAPNGTSIKTPVYFQALPSNHHAAQPELRGVFCN